MSQKTWHILGMGGHDSFGVIVVFTPETEDKIEYEHLKWRNIKLDKKVINHKHTWPSVVYLNSIHLFVQLLYNSQTVSIIKCVKTKNCMKHNIPSHHKSHSS